MTLPGDIPDARDGLTRAERVILFHLSELEKKSNGRPVPSAMIYGRVVEHINISVWDFERLLAKLVGRSLP